MWAHKHWRHKDSFMCFSWTPKMTDVVTRLGCGWDGCSGTCTAFALPQSELLVKGQELKNVIFRGSVKYVIPRFHRWGGVGWGGWGGTASLTPTQTERSWATCFAWFCDCSAFSKYWVGWRCDEEDWVCVAWVLWRVARRISSTIVGWKEFQQRSDSTESVQTHRCPSGSYWIVISSHKEAQLAGEK